MTHWSDALESVGPRRLRACDEAVAWARTQPDAAAAWAACERLDWMIWLLAAGTQDLVLRIFSADCAERALRAERVCGREPDARSWAVVEVARRHARGEASDAELTAARRDAWAAWRNLWDIAAAVADADAAAAADAADAEYAAAVAAAVADADADADADAAADAAVAAAEAICEAPGACEDEAAWQRDRLRVLLPGDRIAALLERGADGGAT